MIKKMSIYELENGRFRCDDFTRNKHIRALEYMDSYADQWEYILLFREDFFLVDFKK